MNITSLLTDFRMEQPLILLLMVPALILLRRYVKDGGGRRTASFTVSRLLILTCLFAALSSPHLISKGEHVSSTPQVVVLSDKSASMRLYGGVDDTLLNMLDRRLNEYNLTANAEGKVLLKFFSDGENKTAIGDALYESMIESREGNAVFILESDGVSNYGRSPTEAAKTMAERNMTVYAVYPEKSHQDIALVGLTGKKKIPANTEYTLKTEIGWTNGAGNVSSDGGPLRYVLTVYVDGLRREGRAVTQTKPTEVVEFRFRINETGVHEIRVDLDPKDEEDFFPYNNRLYKSIEVVEKPKILLVTNKTDSPLNYILRETYDVDAEPELDSTTDLNRYSAVILDDVHGFDPSLSRNTVGSLRDYILDGNGLVVVGGRNSYEYGNYSGSYIEGLLPVKSTEKPKERRKNIAIIFLIDISGSTEYKMGEESKIDLEKALVLKMIRDLDENDSVGVLAFNTIPYVVSDMRKLKDSRNEINENVLRLRFGGGTDLIPALDSAGRILKDYALDKYLVVVSDGVVRTNSITQALETAGFLYKNNIRVYAIGVGADTNEEFMSMLAENGGGVYFKPEAYQRLRIEFGRIEETPETKGQYPLRIYSKHHFITEDITLDYSTVSISDFNRVAEKSIAQVLITDERNQPVVTAWQFGLGRVVSITTDDGRSWSPQLYASDDGMLVSSIVNWIIGDFEKKRKIGVAAGDLNLGESGVVSVRSEGTPILTVEYTSDRGVSERKNIPLKKTYAGVYQGVFTPATVGFYKLQAEAEGYADVDAIAVNTPVEFRTLGVDYNTLRQITGLTGGGLYQSSVPELSRLADKVSEIVKEKSLMRDAGKKPLELYFIVLSVLVYVADAVVRRSWDIWRVMRENKA